MQTILGAGGTIGLELAGILPDYTDRVRLVSRTPEVTHLNSEAHPADLLDAAAVEGAVKGSEVVYLLVGLPYKAHVWESQWPVIMRNVIAACRASGSKLVFFDNIYMYDRAHLSPMDEGTPVRPSSRKGAVRAAIADALMSAVRKGDIEGLIARCADFYGPGRQNNSVLTLPTAPAPPTGKGWVEAIAAELGVEPKLQVMPPVLLSLAGLVSPTLREIKEMAYQYDRDYDFRSEKFERRFGFVPTGYEQGIQAIVDADYR
jgi:nucleoside-diphosphate-sugar epimerase